MKNSLGLREGNPAAVDEPPYDELEAMMRQKRIADQDVMHPGSTMSRPPQFNAGELLMRQRQSRFAM